MISRSEHETRAFAARLGRLTRAGDVICLRGPLGSGKTTFIQGFARAAGFKGSVVSPTFGLTRQYRARRFTLHHLDLFRIRPKETINLGLEEYFFDPRGVCLVEWPEAAQAWLPPDRLEIALAHRRDGGRTLRLRPRGARARRLMRCVLVQ